MSFTLLRVRVLSCDHPGCDSSFELGAGDTVYRVRYYASREGWRFVGGPTAGRFDYCPSHAENGTS